MKTLLLTLVLVAALLVPDDVLVDLPRLPGGVVETGGGRVSALSLVDEPGAGRALPLTLPHAERLVLRGGGDDGPDAVFEVRLAPPDVLYVTVSHGSGARGGLIVEMLQRRGTLGTVRLAVFDARVGDGTSDDPSPGRAGRPADTLGGESPAALAVSPTDASTRGVRSLDVRWEPPVEGEYLVRVAAVPGTVGAFAIALGSRPPLDFPVATAAADSVRSFFGDARDGGARDHHGIDIFAPRGTPVLAAADGVVARVGTSTRGGLHVWQRAEDRAGGRIGSLYYAHLDSVAVLAGTRVTRGEVLGTVGNTGNARTTPPHLHFGLYRRYRGPEDPLPLVGTARVELPEPAPGHALAAWLAVDAPALNVRAGPGTAFEVIDRLERGALVRVLAVGDRWARVRLRSVAGETGEGFVSVGLLAPPDARPFAFEASAELLGEPASDAPRLVTLGADAALRSLGTFGRFRAVETSGGTRGWVLEGDASGEVDGTLPDG